MRFALIATFAAVSVAPLPAGAQDLAAPCAFYEDLIAAAPSKFEAYRDMEQAPGLYAATFQPPQFPNCTVFAQEEAALLCYGAWGPRAVLRVVYTAELGRMRSCLTGWEAQRPFPTAEPQFEIVEGVRYLRETDAGTLTLGLAFVRETAGAGRHRASFAILFQPPRPGV